MYKIYIVKFGRSIFRFINKWYRILSIPFIYKYNKLYFKIIIILLIIFLDLKEFYSKIQINPPLPSFIIFCNVSCNFN